MAAYVALLSLAIFLYLGAALTEFFPGVPVVLPGGHLLYVSAFPAVSVLLLGLGVALGAYAWMLGRHLRQGDAAGWRSIFLPLFFLPLAFAPFLLPHPVLPLASNVLLFLPVALLAACGVRLWGALEPWLDGVSTQRLALLLLIALVPFYSVLGIWTSLRLGEAGSDEGHYLVQAHSLYTDGDLDLRNNFGLDLEAAIQERIKGLMDLEMDAAERRARAEVQVRDHLHVRARAQEDGWYSYHAVGLPLLLTPAGVIGMPGRHVVLGLISAAACIAILTLSIQLGASRASAFGTVLLFGLSGFWTFYAIRALPEALGGTLFAVSLAGALHSMRRPIAGSLVAVVAAACLPWAHLRFSGWAVAALGFLVLAWAVRTRKLRTMLIGGAACVAILAGLAGLYLVFTRSLFVDGLPYPTEGVFFVRPAGLWMSFFSSRGIVYTFPLFGLLIGAALAAAIGRGQARWFARFSLAIVAMYALMFSTSVCWEGSPMRYGRLIVSILPILVPVLAVSLSRREAAPLRWWAAVLVLQGTALTLVSAANFDHVVDAWFMDLHLPAKRSIPMLAGLLDPFGAGDIERMGTHAYPFVLVAILIALAFRPSSRRFGWAAGIGIVLAAVLMDVRTPRVEAAWSPRAVSVVLERMPLERARSYSRGTPLDGFEISNRYPDFHPRGITTAPVSAPAEDTQLWSAQDLGVNGWEGRGLRWLPLVEPMREGTSGRYVGLIAGRLEGEARAYFAVQEGAKAVLYTELPVSNGVFELRYEIDKQSGASHIFHSCRIEGEGTVWIDRFVWSPRLPGPAVVWNLPDADLPRRAAEQRSE